MPTNPNDSSKDTTAKSNRKPMKIIGSKFEYFLTKPAILAIVRLITASLLVISTIIIIVLIVLFFRDGGFDNPQLGFSVINMDFWGLVLAWASFGVGLLITFILEKNQSDDTNSILSSLEKLDQTSAKIENFASQLKIETNELLNIQRQLQNSYVDVLQKAQFIIKNADDVKVMTYTTTLGTVYAEIETEIKTFWHKKNVEIDKEVTLPKRECLKAKKILTNEIILLREEIMNCRKVEFATYPADEQSLLMLEKDFLSKINSKSSIKDSEKLQLIEDIKKEHIRGVEEIHDFIKNKEEQNATHRHHKVDEIPIQMFIGRKEDLLSPENSFKECLIIFENLAADDSNHILAFSSTNDSIVEFFESVFHNTLARHTVAVFPEIVAVT